MKVVSESSGDVCVNEMDDGNVAVITKNDTSPGTVGKVVQRYGANLVLLGEPSGKGWSFMWGDGYHAGGSTFLVRILHEGTTIQI